MSSDLAWKAAHFRPMFRRVLRSGLVLLSLAFFVRTSAGTGLPPVPPLPHVHIGLAQPSGAAPVGEGPNAIRVLLSAELETSLAAQMVGQIDGVRVGLGDLVKAGQLLVQFDCAESAARLKMAQAELAAARIAVNKSASAIEVASAQLAYCEVKAPFDGHVVKIHVKPYQSVNQGAPLVELVSKGALKLRMNVPSQLLRKIKVGSPMTVDIMETGNNYAAEVTAINARVDAVAQTIELEARLTDSPPELLPGMSGVARFVE